MTDDQTALFPGGSPTVPSANVPLTPTQIKIIAKVRELGAITPAAAGTILHEARGHCGHGDKGGTYAPGSRSTACCAYASSDGLEALKRLVARGVVARVGKGRYEPLPVAGWPTPVEVSYEGYARLDTGTSGWPPVDERDIAEIAREEAIERVDRGMDAEWRERALLALQHRCRVGGKFTTDELREQMMGDEPREPRAFGSIMRRGRANGWCEPVDEWRISDRVSNHKRPERVWISLL